MALDYLKYLEADKERERLLRRIANYETRFAAVGAEPPPPKRESNLLLSALDILDRPRSAILAGLTGRGFMKGLTGQERVNVADLLSGVENKFLRGALGFVGDVLLDPLTYLTLGTAGVAKGAATQGARRMLKFAGQPLADVTPLAEAASRTLQKTGLPEMLGPVFSSRYIRRAVTSPEELPDVQKAVEMTRGTQRLIRGQQQEALEELQKLYRGISPEAAARAAQIIEAPTMLKRAGIEPPLPKPKVTVKREPAQLVEEMISPKLPKPERTTFEEAVSLPKTGRIAGIKPTIEVPELGKAMKESAITESAEEILSMPTPKAPGLKLPATAAQVRFEKKPLEEITQATATTIPEMFQAAKKAGIDITPESRAAAVMARKVTEQTTAKDIAAGVEFEQIPDYVRHLYKDPPEKVQQILAKWQKDRAKLPGRKAGFQKERTIPTIAEAKRLGLTPIEDVRILTAVREMEGIKQRAINGMYREIEKIGKNVMRDVKDSPAGWKTLPGIPQLKDKAVHPEIARHLERFNSTVNSVEGMRNLLSLMNGVQNFWKGLVTAPNPAFHIRNAMSNVFNNFLAGVVNPKLYGLAMIAQKGGNEVFNLGGRRYTGKELRRIFREQGLEGFGFFYGESPRGMLREAEEAFGKRPVKERISPIQRGRQVGDWLETNAKMAHFIDRLNKGDTVEQAAESVRKYLFDYGDLTEAEKKIRNFVPFYTFTRKNIPLQLESFITKPGKMTAFNKLVENTRQAQGVQEGDIPDWMKSELAVSLGENENLLLDLPLTQLNMLAGVKGTFKSAAGMLTPLAKMPIEVAMGRSIFTGQPLEKLTRVGGLDMPWPAAYGISQLGAIPRAAGDIIGAFKEAAPKDSSLPPPPQQIPILRTFIRRTDPERERQLRLLQREQQLADFRNLLANRGIEIPTMEELERGRKRKGYFY